MDFDVQYESSSTSNYLVLAPNVNTNIINYQSQMLLNNKIDGLLSFNINFTKERWHCYYDVTSKYTLENFLARKRFSRNEFLITLRMLINNIFNLKNYLLYDSNILLDEKYIYIEPESMMVYFAYLPFQGCKNDIKSFFINLIVKLTNFQNEDSDNYIQKILEVIKSDLFNLISLKNLIENLLGEDIKNEAVFTKEDIKTDNPKGKIEKHKVEKEKAIKGIVKIPKGNNAGQPKSHEESCKSDAFNKKKINMLLLGIQPALFIVFILTVSSNIVKMSGNPQATTAILLFIFTMSDILLIRVIKERMKKSGDTDGYKPLQFITDNMKSIRTKVDNSRNIADLSRDSKEYDLGIADDNIYKGETVIIPKSKSDGIPYLKEKDGEEIIRIDKESVLIGRMESFVDYVVNSNAVGKIHAEVMNEQGNFYVMDCNSRNGTYLNGTRVIPNTKVKVNFNDELRFANKEFIFVC